MRAAEGEARASTSSTESWYGRSMSPKPYIIVVTARSETGGGAHEDAAVSEEGTSGAAKTRVRREAFLSLCRLQSERSTASVCRRPHSLNVGRCVMCRWRTVVRQQASVAIPDLLLPLCSPRSDPFSHGTRQSRVRFQQLALLAELKVRSYIDVSPAR